MMPFMALGFPGALASMDVVHFHWDVVRSIIIRSIIRINWRLHLRHQGLRHLQCRFRRRRHRCSSVAFL